MKYKGQIYSKLPKVGTTIFSIMSNLANKHNAINLSQGFPDFNCDNILIDAINKYMKKGYNQYAPMIGVKELREKIVEKTEYLYSISYHPEKEITITAGATQALYTAITTFVKEGDEVVVFEPAYDAYVPVIELCGGIPIYVSLKSPDFSFDWDRIKKVINQRTKMIIINSPHNPTGSIIKEADLKMLDKLTKDTNIIILSDEVYEHIIFDNNPHESILKYKSLAERSFVISSFGKTYHTTGLKMGYCLAPENLMNEFRKVHQFAVYAVNTPIQYAYSEILDKKEMYLELNAFYQEKRDFFINLIKGSKFKIKPAKGTYFQLLDYSNISKENEVSFANKLTIEHGVAAIPVSVFYHDAVENNVLRFCFAKSNETLEKAAEKLHKI